MSTEIATRQVVFEIVQRGIGTLHVAIDDFRHVLPLQFRIESIEAFVKAFG